MSIELNSYDQMGAQALAKLVRDLNSTGHNPATSGNYSLRMSDQKEYALVSESGIDKNLFHENNFIPVNIQTTKLHPDYISSGRKSSDETDIHLCLFRATNAQCVLHSHLLEALLFADLYPNQDFIELSGMELLKGLKGIKTHETTVKIACFENTQDITHLSGVIENVLKNNPQTYAVMLRHHGIYIWGETVKDAKRHLEVFEYLFKYFLASKRH